MLIHLPLPGRRHCDSGQYGYATLIGVLVVAAVGLASAISLLTLGLGASQTSVVEVQSAQARHLADACIEEGLFQIRELGSSAGAGSLAVGDGTCSYEVSEASPGDFRVHGVGMVGDVVRRSEAIGVRVGDDGAISVDRWRDTPLFSS